MAGPTSSSSPPSRRRRRRPRWSARSSRSRPSSPPSRRTGEHYGKVSIALLLTAGAPAASADGTAATLPEDAVVRAIVTNDLTGLPSSDLIDRPKRNAIEKKILTDLQKKTDVKVSQVLFTDVVVQ